MPRIDLIQFRRGTAAAWTSANPVLSAGEPGFESDTNKQKIGDGTTAWNSLPYASGGGSGTVESVTGDGVDNTDSANPVISFPDASEVEFTPAGGISSTNVQDAIEELDAAINEIITFRTLTANHELDSTDLSNSPTVEIQMNVASSNTVTIPPDSTVDFPVGSRRVIRQIGTGQTAIVAGSGVTLNSPNGWLNIAYRYASVVITKTSTDEWNIEGTLAP